MAMLTASHQVAEELTGEFKALTLLKKPIDPAAIKAYLSGCVDK
jgi:hypothetical protein